MLKIAVLYIMIMFSALVYGYEKIGSYYGDNPENLKKPVSLEIDSNGNFYVLDYTGGKIVVFDKNYKYKESIGGFNNPSSISILYLVYYFLRVLSSYIVYHLFRK